MTQGMTLSTNTSSNICELKSHQEQLEFLQHQYLQKRQQLLQYQTYLTSQMAAQSNQPLKRSQSVQHSSYSTSLSHPSKSGVIRQQSASTVSDLYYQHHQNQIASLQQSQQDPLSLPLPNLPKPPCISLQRRDSVKSDTCQQDTSSRYKTEMCRPFEETGNCRYGSKCQFAHGAQELRSLNRHPRYKTEFCRTFHTTGFCSYGQRCNFIHNEDERRSPQQQQQPSTALPTRPTGLSISSNSGAPLKNATGSLGSAGSLMSSSTSVSPASSVYGGDMSPIHTPSYLSDDALSSRLSPTPSLSSDISFPSPTGSSHLNDDIFEQASLDYNLSFSLINSLNL